MLELALSMTQCLAGKSATTCEFCSLPIHGDITKWGQQRGHPARLNSKKALCVMNIVFGNGYTGTMSVVIAMLAVAALVV